jgi:hypothetical protein
MFKNHLRLKHKFNILIIPLKELEDNKDGHKNRENSKPNMKVLYTQSEEIAKERMNE